ncbi:MAG TPA: right-handed parallel beta-helix repeat-containing protein [Thermoanaerobaculia bacterium]
MAMRSVVAAVLLLLAAPLRAATFTVTSGADSGDGTLRWAIESANAAPQPKSIYFAVETVRPTSPLPPITDYVDIAGGTIDGSLAGDADGLVIRSATGGWVRYLTVTNFSRDGIVVDSDGVLLSNLTLSHNRNGIQVRGTRNILTGSWILDNRVAGVWVTGSENFISKPEYGDIIVDGVPFPSQTVAIAGNQTGIVLDGGGNVVDGAWVDPYFSNTTGNKGDGIVVNHEGNQILRCDIRSNGGAGVRLNAGSDVIQSGGCNTGPFIAGSTQPVPQLLSAVGDTTVTTIDGRLDGAPNSRYRIEIFTVSDPCTLTGSHSFEVTTDVNGSATFHHSAPLTPRIIAATSTLISPNGNATSMLSPPFAVVKNGVSSSDLETTIIAPPRAPIGSTVTVEIHMTNHGPSPINGAQMTVSYSSSLLSVDWTTTSGSCWLGGLKFCQFDVLAPGDTAIVRHRVPVNGAEPAPTYSAATSTHADPYPANDSATVTIEAQPARQRSVRH